MVLGVFPIYPAHIRDVLEYDLKLRGEFRDGSMGPRPSLLKGSFFKLGEKRRNLHTVLMVLSRDTPFIHGADITELQVSAN